MSDLMNEGLLREIDRTLDGQPITESVLYSKMQEARTQGKLIKEISPGVYKTLQHLRD